MFLWRDLGLRGLASKALPDLIGLDDLVGYDG